MEWGRSSSTAFSISVLSNRDDTSRENQLRIESPNRLVEDQPDSVLIIAWNFAEEIMKQQSVYRERGGSFIIPVPEVKVVS